MPRTFILCAVLTLAGVAKGPEVRVTVRPTVMLRGASLQLRCRVEHDPANRVVWFGVAGYTESAREMDGADAPLIYEATFGHVPCDVGPVYCRVRQADGTERQATADIVVTGCELTRAGGR